MGIIKMEKLILIITLFLSLSATGQGNFFASHTSISPGVACTRPSSVASRVFYYGWTPSYGALYDYRATFVGADDYGYYLGRYQPSTGTPAYFMAQALTYAVGDSVYVGTTSDCTKVSNGYYWVRSGASSTYKDSIFHITNGVVADKKNAATIGASYFGGGNLGYILQPGDAGYDSDYLHGLIYNNNVTTVSAIWGALSNTGATASAIGSGNANTNTIVSAYGAGTYAAKAISDDTEFGYSDWYLPTSLEISALYANGFRTSTVVWTSTEVSSTTAKAFNMGLSGGTPAVGTSGNVTKSTTEALIMMRSF